MEYYWTTLFNNSNGSSSSTNTAVRGQNGSFIPTHAWDSWDLPTTTPAASTPPQWPPDFHPVMMLHDQEQSGAGGGHSIGSTTTSSSSSHYCNIPDPHLTCLKLGKRQYFEDLSRAGERQRGVGTKRGKAGAAAAEAAVPRCQVEGCEAVLVNAKDYHRRHKVCEMHAKAPKVVLHGIEQRFCQQCSRFHSLSEFDEAKRSCRRRLAGHNERRRKGAQDHNTNTISISNSIARKQYYNYQGRLNDDDSESCALSLLSPTYYAPWNTFTTSSDLPARCSAALRELIAENRQLINANNLEDRAGHVTLNLMQGARPGSAFGLHDHRSAEDDGHGDCSDLWKLPLGY